MTGPARPYNRSRRSYHRWECKTCGVTMGVDNWPQEAAALFHEAHTRRGHEVTETHSTVGAEPRSSVAR